MLDFYKGCFRIARQIHLIDQHIDLFDAQQTQHISMAAALFLHALFAVDNQERRFSTCRAGNHILQKFLMARRINNHIVALSGRELNARGVNRDTLLLFFLEGIQQVGIFKGLARIVCDFFDLVNGSLRQRIRIVKQAANDRGFAVVHMTHDDDIQPGFFLF